MNLADGVMAAFFVEVCHVDERFGARESFGHGSADPGSGAGDKAGFVFETEHGRLESDSIREFANGLRFVTKFGQKQGEDGCRQKEKPGEEKRLAVIADGREQAEENDA